MVHLFVCRRGIDFEVMAFELAYRLTFIDAVEAPAVGALPRSRSLPVLGSVPTADEEVQYQAPRQVSMVSGHGAPSESQRVVIIMRS